MLKIIRFDTIPSTNDYLKAHFRELDEFTLVKADYQTAGRGQFRRTWESLPRQNILFSMLLKKNLSEDRVRRCERATLDSLLAFFASYGISARIKLPNDIYVNDEKIAGMLIETKQTAGVYDYLIIGVGLNVRQKEFSSDFSATSMALQLKKDILVEDAFIVLTEELESRFRALIQ